MKIMCCCLMLAGLPLLNQTVVQAQQGESRAAARHGVRWLLPQQAADGGWHSEIYGNMRGGVGNTALVLLALSTATDDEPSNIRQALKKGVQFLTANQDELGLVRGEEKSADYPVYATALLLLATAEQPDLVSAMLTQKLCRGLLAAQRSEANGWPDTHPDYGGWGLLADRDSELRPATSSNVSVTMFVLEALQSREALTPVARREALVFLERCQSRETRGFTFTVRADDPTNKAGLIDAKAASPVARPYSTATCDGVRALLACGVTTEDHRIRAAIEWLTDPADNLRDKSSAENYRAGLRYYEAMTFVRLNRVIHDPKLDFEQRQLQKGLLASQQPNGSWRSSSALMREDDPLIATALAVLALQLTGSD